MASASQHWTWQGSGRNHNKHGEGLALWQAWLCSAVSACKSNIREITSLRAPQRCIAGAKNSRSWWCSWVSSWLRYTGTRAAPRMSSVTLADAENISVILPLAMICVWTKVFAKIFGAEPPRTNKLQLPERKAQGAIITMQFLQNYNNAVLTIRDKIYSYVYSTQYFGQMQSSLQISGKRKCRVLVFSFVFCCPITKMVSCKCLHT